MGDQESIRRRPLYPVLRNSVLGLFTGFAAIMLAMLGLNSYFAGFEGGKAWLQASHEGLVPLYLSQLQGESVLCYSSHQDGACTQPPLEGADQIHFFSIDAQNPGSVPLGRDSADVTKITTRVQSNPALQNAQVNGFLVENDRLFYLYSDSSNPLFLVRDVTVLIGDRIKHTGLLEVETFDSKGTPLSSTWLNQLQEPMHPHKVTSLVTLLHGELDVLDPSTLNNEATPRTGIRSLGFDAPYDGYKPGNFARGDQSFWGFTSIRELPAVSGFSSAYVVITVPGDVMMYYNYVFFVVSCLITLLLLAISIFSLSRLSTKHINPIVTLAKKVERLGERIRDNEVVTPTNEHRIAHSVEVFRLEQALFKLEDQLIQNRELELNLTEVKRLESLGRLAGGVAHDFNNLLNIISVNGSFLLEDVKDPSVRQMAMDIVKASDSATELTQNLLTYARREKATSTSSCNLSAVSKTTVAMLNRTLGPNVDVRVDVKDTPPCALSTTAAQQVLMNLVLNARDACDISGGIIHVRVRQADTSEARTSSHPQSAVLLEVTDNGSGMDPETATTAFDPFFSTKPDGSGTGLGLSMVKSLVEDVGGSIEVTSEMGIGTTFSVSLPTRGPKLTIVKARDNSAITGVRILLVEDNTDVLNSLIHVLERHGAIVEPFADPTAALAFFNANPNQVDLLFTDVLMPLLNGQQLANAVRDVRRDIPVLFVSGFVPDGILTEGFPNSLIMQKPIQATTVLSSITLLFSSSEAKISPNSARTS